MQATMSGYKDSDDGMLLVTVCEDGDLPEIPDDCAYMNEASTSISMELIPNAYYKPLICDGDFCGELELSGVWSSCNYNNKGKNTFYFDSDNFTKEYTWFEGDNCTGSISYQLTNTVPYKKAGSKIIDNKRIAQKIDFNTDRNISFSIHNDGFLSWGNSNNYCGYSDWDKGVSKDVTSCSIFEDEHNIIKDLFYLDDASDLRHGDQDYKDADGYPVKLSCNKYTTGDYSSSAEFICDYDIQNNDMVLDQQRQLRWQRNDNSEKYSFEEAENYCEELKIENYENFRLPEMSDLTSLIIAENTPKIYNYYFDNIKSDFYWSANLTEISSEAFGVDFGTGEEIQKINNEKGYVLCVSGCSIDYNDNESGSLIAVNFSENILDILDGNSIKIYINAIDNCEIEEITADFHNPTSLTSKGSSGYWSSSGLNFNNYNGVWETTYNFNPFQESGLWGIAKISIIDKSGNEKIYEHHGDYNNENNMFENSNIEVPTFELTGTTIDEEAPILEFVSVSPGIVSPYDNLTIQITASDPSNGSGIDYINVTLYEPGGNVPQENHHDWTEKKINFYINQSDYQQINNVYEKNITLGNYNNNGTWRVGLLRIGDNAHNSRTYFYYDNNTNYLWDDNDNDNWMIDSNVNVSEFTLFGSTPDETPPTVEDVIFDPPTLNGPGFVNVEIVVSDNESGVYTSSCSNFPNLRMPKGMNTYPSSCWKYDASKNAFIATFEIKDYYYSGEFILDDIEFEDIAGNKRRYTSHPEQDSYYRYWEDDNEFITNLELFKYPVTGTNPDITPPTIDSVVFEPSSLNGPGEVVIKIFASDNETGIARGNAINGRLFNREYNIEKFSPDWFHYDDESGAFKATITIDNGSPSGEWVFDNIHPTNTVNTWRSYKYNETISLTHYSVWNEDDQSETLSNLPLYTYNISGTDENLNFITLSSDRCSTNLTRDECEAYANQVGLVYATIGNWLQPPGCYHNISDNKIWHNDQYNQSIRDCSEEKQCICKEN